jgi:ornithine--oxo-acid transaminase
LCVCFVDVFLFPVMLQVGPGEHGSTYGGNPLACAVTEAAIGVIDEEQLPLRSHRLGLRFRSLLQPLADQFGWVREVRGRGLMNAIEIDPSHSVSAWELCLRLKDVGLLAKPTHDNIIRFTPPLVISDADVSPLLFMLWPVVL